MSRTRSRPLRRVLLLLCLLVVVALVLGAAAVNLAVRRPLAQHEGTVQIGDLGSTVTVRYDDLGVPSIYASNAADLFRAQGYVQAQDRFFQMDYRRHVTAGRLAELVGRGAGDAAINSDKVVRTLGWRAVAEEEWNALDDTTRSYLKAYADGVNDYLAGRSTSAIAVEYTVLGMRVKVTDPEKWDPIDSLAWLKAMAWDLRGNYDAELGRAATYATLGGEATDVARVDELYPAYPYDQHDTIYPAAERSDTRPSKPTPETPDDGLSHVDDDPDDIAPASYDPGGAGSPSSSVSDGDRGGTVSSSFPVSYEDPGATVSPSSAVRSVNAEDVSSAVFSAQAAIGAIPVLIGGVEGAGSNSWVVSGKYTASGKPLLANDPHLAAATPGVWYQNALHCTTVDETCPFDMAGYSFAGFPGIVIGHNQTLAWGLTNLGADVTDFFLERVRGDQYLVDMEYQTIDRRTETIKVAGGQDVTITVRSTKHGPIISDVVPALQNMRDVPVRKGVRAPLEGGYAVALGWTALTPGTTAAALFALDTARSAEDVAAAAARLDVPAQNIVFATTDGHIGSQVPGRIPIRGKVTGYDVPSDGRWPRPGWDSAFDWKGYLDPADLPSVLDPEEGFVVAANQAATPNGRPFLTYDWDYGYRSQRIRDLLTDDITQGRKIDVATMQRIQLDERNPAADILLPYLLTQKVDSFTTEAVDLLRDWDKSQDVDSPAAAYFAAVWDQVLSLTFDDELPAGQQPDGGSRWLAVMSTLLERPDSLWWDDRTTAGTVETRDEILTQALEEARNELTRRISKDPADWSWGKLHTFAPTHPVLGDDSWWEPIRALANPSPVPVSGGTAVVDATAWDASADDFTVTTAPSMRMVVDLANLDNSRWVNQTGNSGQPGSPHYTDQIKTWAGGGDYPWRFSRALIEQNAEHTLTLSPN